MNKTEKLFKIADKVEDKIQSFEISNKNLEQIDPSEGILDDSIKIKVISILGDMRQSIAQLAAISTDILSQNTPNTPEYDLAVKIDHLIRRYIDISRKI